MLWISIRRLGSTKRSGPSEPPEKRSGGTEINHSFAEEPHYN